MPDPPLHSNVADPIPVKRHHPYRYDAVVKDLVQRDQSSILDAYIGNRKVRGFLNVEFAIVEERIADLLIELDDGSILHIEFQSDNQSAMPYRMGIYGLICAEKHRGRNIEQVVIYLGQDPMSMSSSIAVSGIRVEYELMDIREFDALELLASGRPGDYALALLASGGVGHMRQILEQANQLPEPERRRVFTQMSLLVGLRGASEHFRMEMKAMGVYIEIEENVVLKDIYDAGMEKGREEGRQEARASMATVLHTLIEDRFGPLPGWAEARITGASIAELERWARNVLSAPTMEAALGR